MEEWKSKSYEDAVQSKGFSRIAKLRWWFIVLVILGLAAVIFLFVRITPEAVMEIQKKAHVENILIGAALAQPTVTPSNSTTVNPKPIIILGIFLVLGIILLLSIYKILFSSNTDQVATAGDIAKTLLGFFVGVGTNFFGI